MPSYKHTQVGYLVIISTIIVLGFFTWAYLTARAEPASVDSGTNLAVTSIMVFIVFILVSFTTLTVSIDEKYLRVKFGFGIFKKKFLLEDISSVNRVKNRWYYGWGIRIWFWPRMMIFNVSGFDAVEIVTKRGRIYRIGTDVPAELELEINKRLN